MLHHCLSCGEDRRNERRKVASGKQKTHDVQDMRILRSEDDPNTSKRRPTDRPKSQICRIGLLAGSTESSNYYNHINDLSMLACI